MYANDSNHRWWALAVLATAQFMVIMDTSIIGVALPDMQADLGFAPTELSWVFNAYVIAFGGLLLLGGKLADQFGGRRVFSSGFAVLASASLLAGLADTKELEIAARALQGAGAALIAPAGLALLMALFGNRPQELTKALAVYGAAAPAGGTAGVFLGGALTEWFDWPWVFYVNIPVGLVVLLASPRLLPQTPRRAGRLDIAGALTVTGALSAVVFGVVRAPEAGWGSLQAAGSIAAGIAVLGVFVALQRAQREPLLPLSIFRTPNLAISNVIMALLGAAWVPMWYFLNLYLQQVLGYGPLKAGSALLPMTGLMMILMVAVTERLVARSGIGPVLRAGMAALTVALGAFAFVRPDGVFVVDVLGASLIAALGMSLAYIPAMVGAMSSARPEEAGIASGIVNTTYQVGSALGLGIMTAIATSNGADDLGNLDRLADGFSAAFIGAAAVAAVATAAAFRVRSLGRVTEPPPGDQELSLAD